MAPTDLVSFFVLVVIATGLSQRRDRTRHIPLMALAFVVDLGLVLYLELTRSAVARASELASQMLSIHVGFAITTLVLNIALIASGVAIAKGKPGLRKWHKRLAALFLFCRISTFLTAFWIPPRG